MRVDVVKQYLISKSNEKFSKKSTDSVLNFVLRLLCRLLLLPISCESDDAKVDLLLPASFLSDLYCTVIKLLAIRFMLDLIILLESGESIQELQSSLLQNFRDDCKIALEHSSRAGSPIDVGVAAGRSTCALDCTVYTTYVTIEHYIGRFCAVLETSHSAGDRIHPLDDFGSKVRLHVRFFIAILPKFNLILSDFCEDCEISHRAVFRTKRSAPITRRCGLNEFSRAECLQRRQWRVAHEVARWVSI